MNDWPATLFAAAERITPRESGPGVSLRLARAAARLGLRDEAKDLAADVERAGGEWLADAAQIDAAIGNRAAVDRLLAAASLETASDPLGLQTQTFAAAYQRLGDYQEADRLVQTIRDPDERLSAVAVLIHEAVASGDQERVSSLARTLAVASTPDDQASTVVLALIAARADQETAAQTAPVAERLARTLGAQSQDATMVSVARLWLAAGRPKEALRIARPLARRASPDFNSEWYADLAQVLIDAGDEAAGTALLERHVEWHEREDSASGFARAARALVRAGRQDDAGYLIEKAERQLEATDPARGEDARRVLIDIHLSLGDIPAAIRAAAALTDPTEQSDALIAIAQYGRDHAIASSAAVDEAIADIGGAS